MIHHVSEIWQQTCVFHIKGAICKTRCTFKVTTTKWTDTNSPQRPDTSTPRLIRPGLYILSWTVIGCRSPESAANSRREDDHGARGAALHILTPSTHPPVGRVTGSMWTVNYQQSSHGILYEAHFVCNLVFCRSCVYQCNIPVMFQSGKWVNVSL